MERIGPLSFKYRKIKRIKSSCIFCIVPFDKFIVIVLYVVIILIFKQNIVYTVKTIVSLLSPETATISLGKVEWNCCYRRGQFTCYRPLNRHFTISRDVLAGKQIRFIGLRHSDTVFRVWKRGKSNATEKFS